ncbi:hypothetical protein [Yoonia sp. SS1-5]|uniref:Uncharacterized protein n=1 Tax=Yoonia rhodophyticola TaxID=3137370 RepID=A0AAN0NLB5_9RHOB
MPLSGPIHRVILKRLTGLIAILVGSLIATRTHPTRFVPFWAADSLLEYAETAPQWFQIAHRPGTGWKYWPLTPLGNPVTCEQMKPFANPRA